jgi:hypothetical protein
MIIKEKKRSIIDYWDLTNVLVLIVGMLYSPFLCFLGICLCGVRILLIGNIKEKIKKIKKYYLLLLVLTSIFWLNLLGILWSKDINNGFQALYHKLPFLVLPLYICIISPLRKEWLRYIFSLYIIALVFGCCWGVVNYLTSAFPNPRLLIPFTDHIRFGLNLCFAIAVLSIIIYRNRHDRRCFWLIAIIIWFLIFIALAQMVSSIVVCCIIAIVGSFILLKNKNSKYSIAFAVLLLGIVLSFGIWIASQYKDYFQEKEPFNVNLNQKTRLGNYYKNTDDKFIENGYYVSKYVCEKEVGQAWKQRTGLSLEDSCNNGDGRYPYSFIIYRYLNSKGLKKDYDGVMSLSNEDINNIKHGYANVVYSKRFSLSSRLYRTFFEFERYYHTHHVSSMSIIQRYVCCKNALQVSKRNIFFGVGTGDIHYLLEKNLRETYPNYGIDNNDPHNFFIFIFTGFGFLGLLVLWVFLLYPPCKLKLWRDKVFIVFFIVALCGMTAESSFELTSGMIFYSLLSSLLFFNKIYLDDKL